MADAVVSVTVKVPFPGEFLCNGSQLLQLAACSYHLWGWVLIDLGEILWDHVFVSFSMAGKPHSCSFQQFVCQWCELSLEQWCALDWCSPALITNCAWVSVWSLDWGYFLWSLSIEAVFDSFGFKTLWMWKSLALLWSMLTLPCFVVTGYHSRQGVVAVLDATKKGVVLENRRNETGSHQ